MHGHSSGGKRLSASSKAITLSTEASLNDFFILVKTLFLTYLTLVILIDLVNNLLTS